MKNPLVSIVITTKNEENNILRLLKSTEDQDYKNIEIVVVDNNSSDRTKEICKRFTSKVFNKGPERSAQRNFGAQKAKGDYLLFLDADMELSKNVLGECIRIFVKDKSIGAVVVPEESVAHNYWEKVKAFERSFYNFEGDIDTDAARFFSKDAFNKAGGYDESITGPEDWDLPEVIVKLGYKQGRAKNIIYHHEKISSPFQIAKKKYYYALKSHKYLKKHNTSVFSPKTIYFLRPVFYKNWKKFVLNPFLAIGMVLMLTGELVAGGFGYLVGKYNNY